MALVKTMNDMAETDIAGLQNELDQLSAQADEASDEGKLAQELEWLHYKLMNEVSCILLAQLDADVDFAKIAMNQKRIDYLRNVLE